MNPESEKIKLLVVEDDAIIAESLVLTLRQLHYEVADPCADVEEAHHALEKERYDLVLVDIHLFGQDSGIELGRLISGKYHTPFIFLTAFSDAETINRASNAGPSAYLIKPASPAMLFAAIQTALHNFRQHTDAPEKQEITGNPFFVKMNDRLYRVDWEQVVSIETSKNYAIINSCGKQAASLPIRGSLQYVLQLIPPHLQHCFVQINRRVCINICHAEQVEKNILHTTQGAYEIGDSYRKNLLERMNIV